MQLPGPRRVREGKGRKGEKEGRRREGITVLRWPAPEGHHEMLNVGVSILHEPQAIGG
jgi:hypothetical protein